MLASLVILTGASGVGKTSIAQLIEEMGTDILVYQGDRIGVPSGEIMANYGRMDENEPGGPVQRGFALYWIGVIAEKLRVGRPVLLEVSCRIAFLREAVRLHNVSGPRIILVECSDESREARLRLRGHPELANEQMRGWSRYLHQEAEEFRYEILETTSSSLKISSARVLSYFRPYLSS